MIVTLNIPGKYVLIGPDTKPKFYVLLGSRKLRWGALSLVRFTSFKGLLLKLFITFAPDIIISSLLSTLKVRSKNEDYKRKLGVVIRPWIIEPNSKFVLFITEDGDNKITKIGVKESTKIMVHREFEALSHAKIDKEQSVLLGVSVPKILEGGNINGGFYLIQEYIAPTNNKINILEKRKLAVKLNDFLLSQNYPTIHWQKNPLIKEMLASMNGVTGNLAESFNSLYSLISDVFSTTDILHCPCHGDLSESNIIQAENRLILIDWEDYTENGTLIDLKYFELRCYLDFDTPFSLHDIYDYIAILYLFYFMKVKKITNERYLNSINELIEMKS